MVLKKPLFGTLEVADIAALLRMENLPIHMVAALLNVSRFTLAEWRQRQAGPPFIRLKRGVIVYPREAFGRYLKSTHRAEIEATVGVNSRKHVSLSVRKTLNYGEGIYG